MGSGRGIRGRGHVPGVGGEAGTIGREQATRRVWNIKGLAPVSTARYGKQDLAS